MNQSHTHDDGLRSLLLAALCVVFGAATDAGAQPARDASRGELLYSTHCIGCHGTQVHWREKTLVTDLASLRAQVVRWQKTTDLKWSDEDIAEVTRYLNVLHYHYPAPQ